MMPTYQILNMHRESFSGRLRQILSKAFPGCTPSESEADFILHLALAEDAEFPEALREQVPMTPESFIVRSEGRTVYLLGRDLRGLGYAVDALAEHLGAGHYLSFDTPPRPNSVPAHATWSLTDAPLARRRILFNWHNFMSGCSAWNERDWFHWIEQGRKQRLNAIMVHCYSNSPMLEAEVNGVTRPTGWLTTSVKGRDWGAQHANDVRRIPGADPLFDGPAFGADAGLVPDEQRVAAMKGLMRRVFDHARSSDMDVYLAVDVDCQTDHPQAVLDTIPAEAKIVVNTPAGPKAFVHPEHPDGIAVYRQVIENLLRDFPQVTNLVAWFRGKKSPWGLLSHLKVEDMPEAWRDEYRQREPEFSDAMRFSATAQPPYLFALAKIVRTYQQVLREVGRNDVELLCGSWDMFYLDSFHFFVDRSVPLMVLDYSIQFETFDFQQALSSVSREREVIPILWAHHDDHSYIGRSYVPVPRLHSRFRSMGVDSFGIIHWTTRPLDLYFKNTCRQVWSATRNEALTLTTRRMAEDLFGRENAAALADYLYLWITTGPIFGVETNQHFMSDRFKPFEDPSQHILMARLRLCMLENIPQPGALDPQGKTWLNFYQDAERFVIAFQEVFDAMLRCPELPLDEARALLSRLDPREALRVYARHIAHGDTTQGERGVLYSMATRWWVFYEEMRQAAGLTPVRLTFGHTQHDPLATLPGKYTFFFDTEGTPWLQRGELETGNRIAALPGNEELEANGVELSAGLNLSLTAWFDRPFRVPLTRITLRLFSAECSLQIEWLDADGHTLSTAETPAAPLLALSIPPGSARLRLRSSGAILTCAWMDCGSLRLDEPAVGTVG